MDLVNVKATDTACVCACERSLDVVAVWRDAVVCSCFNKLLELPALAQIVNYMKLSSFAVSRLVTDSWKVVGRLNFNDILRWRRNPKNLHVCIRMAVSGNEGRWADGVNLLGAGSSVAVFPVELLLTETRRNILLSCIKGSNLFIYPQRRSRIPPVRLREYHAVASAAGKNNNLRSFCLARSLFCGAAVSVRGALLYVQKPDCLSGVK